MDYLSIFGIISIFGITSGQQRHKDKNSSNESKKRMSSKHHKVDIYLKAYCEYHMLRTVCNGIYAMHMKISAVFFCPSCTC